jgi:hypothetical protein
MEIINLTPHEVVIMDNNKEIILKLPKCPNPPRLSERREVVGIVNNTLINRVTFSVEGDYLPPQKEGTYYVVSRLIAEAIKREDLLIPDEAVRDEEGRIIGCKSFAII